MRSSTERGFSALLVPFILSILFLVGAIGFGGWAYTKMLDYKDNTDRKIQAAVTVAKQEESAAKDQEFEQKYKEPFRTYTGPSAYGSVSIQYPRTWSGYVDDTSTASPFIDGYFYPDVVPDIKAQGSALALRIQVVSESYSTVLAQAAGLVQQGKVKVTPYAAPKVPSIVGARLDGQLISQSQKSGSMVILPLRNTTLMLWTEAPQFQTDFENILSNLTFAP